MQQPSTDLSSSEQPLTLRTKSDLADAMATGVENTSPPTPDGTLDTSAPAPMTQEEISAKFGREPFVSDATWAQLEADQAQAYADTHLARTRLTQWTNNVANTSAQLAKAESALAQAKTRTGYESPTHKVKYLQRKEKGLRKAKREVSRARQRLAEVQKQIRGERLSEAAMQAYLRRLKVCQGPYGEWVKQADGYRCVGGGHFVSDEELLDRLSKEG